MLPPLLPSPRRRLQGIVLRKSYVYNDVTLSATTPPSQLANPETAFACLKAVLLSEASPPCTLSTDQDITDLMETSAPNFGYVPWGSSFWTDTAKAVRGPRGGQRAAQRCRCTAAHNLPPCTPAPARLSPPHAAQAEDAASNSVAGINPDAGGITRKSAEGLGAYARNLRYMHAPVEALSASPDAKFFPGLPPAGTTHYQGTLTRTINGSMADRGWQGFGVYALPGQVLNITIPQALLSANPRLHIGGWTDLLYR